MKLLPLCHWNEYNGCWSVLDYYYTVFMAGIGALRLAPNHLRNMFLCHCNNSFISLETLDPELSVSCWLLCHRFSWQITGTLVLCCPLHTLSQRWFSIRDLIYFGSLMHFVFFYGVKGEKGDRGFDLYETPSHDETPVQRVCISFTRTSSHGHWLNLKLLLKQSFLF